MTKSQLVLISEDESVKETVILLQRCVVCGIKQSLYADSLCERKTKGNFCLPFNQKTQCQGNNLGTSQVVNSCKNFSEYFVLFITKASNFVNRKLMVCFRTVPAVKAS